MTEDFANYVSRIHRVNRGPALPTVAPIDDEDTGFSTGAYSPARTETPMPDLCACRPRAIRLHQRGSCCGDTQHELVTQAIVDATNTATTATDWMEQIAAAVLQALRGTCVVPGCPFDPVVDGRCLPHLQPRRDHTIESHA